MGVGVIRFQAEGFLVLADRFVDLAFLAEGNAEVIVRVVIVRRDFERMPEQGFRVLPIANLLPRQRQPEHNRRTPRQRQRQDTVVPGSGQFARAPDGQNQHPERRHISETIRHGLRRPAWTNPITGTSAPKNHSHPISKQGNRRCCTISNAEIPKINPPANSTSASGQCLGNG